MAIDLYWDDDEQRALLCVFDGRWNWDELYATLKTIRNITEDLPHEVAAIIDIRKGMHFPGGAALSAQSLDNARQLLTMSDSGTGAIYIVGGGGVIRTIYDTMRALNPRTMTRVRFVDSVRAAREQIGIGESA
jgi:hypothetical protein